MPSPFANILTKKNLTNDCCKLKLTTAEIARKYRTTTFTVYAYMKRFGISTIKPIERTKDLKGIRFGRLIPICRGPLDRHGKTRWNCKCKCGKKKLIHSSSLIAGLTISCGCWNSLKNRTGYRDLSGAYLRRLASSASKRGFKFSITAKYVWKLYKSKGGKCVLTNLPIVFAPNSNHCERQTASIDRIDSNKGYIAGNIQIIHKVVNMIKGWLSPEEFIAMCNLVANTHHLSRKEALKAFSRKIFRKNSRK